MMNTLFAEPASDQDALSPGGGHVDAAGGEEVGRVPQPTDWREAVRRTAPTTSGQVTAAKTLAAVLKMLVWT